MGKKGVIGFQTLACLECGQNRILGSVCDDCGYRPRTGEVNADVVRRRTVIASLDRRIEELGNAEPVEPGLPSSGVIGTAVDEVAEALKSFLDNMDSSEFLERLAAGVVALNRLRDGVAAFPARRPEIPVHKATVAALERGYLFWSDFRAALIAETMHEAQRLSGRGQKHLDSLAEAFLEQIRSRDAAEAFEGNAQTSLFARVFKGIERSYPGISILDVDEFGRTEAATLTGVDVASGMGAEFLILDTVGAAHFDSIRLRRVLMESAQFCSNSPLLASIAESDGVLEGLAASRRRLAEALDAFEMMMRTATNNETAFNRMMRLHAEVYEEVAGPLFALYLLIAGAKSKPYLKLISEGATASSAALTNLPNLDEWFIGRDAFLRNAAQHGGSFRVDGQNVVFTLKSYQATHPLQEIVDMILANFESLAVASWALRNAFEVAGIDSPLSDADADYFGLSGVEFARFMLSFQGLEVEVLGDDGNWNFEVSGDGANAFNLAYVIALSATAGGIRTVTIGLEGAESETLELTLSAYREFVTSEGRVQGAAAVQVMLELRHASRIDGRGIVTASDLMFGVTHAGALLLAGDVSEIALLRRVRTLAAEYGFDDVQRLSTEVFNAFRNGDAEASRTLQRRLIALGEATSPPAAPTSDRVRVLVDNP